MVKVRTLLTEGGFPIDYGWCRGTSGNVHKLEDKNGCKETPFNDTESTFRRDEVLWVRSRRQGRSGFFRESHVSGFDCYCCKRTGHGWRDCPERVCNKCGEKGHDPSDPQCPLSYREWKLPNNYGASRKVYRVNEDNTDEGRSKDMSTLKSRLLKRFLW